MCVKKHEKERAWPPIYAISGDCLKALISGDPRNTFSLLELLEVQYAGGDIIPICDYYNGKGYRR